MWYHKNYKKSYESLESYINKEISKIDRNILELEQLEQSRKLKLEELKYKHELLGAFFELCTIKDVTIQLRVEKVKE